MCLDINNSNKIISTNNNTIQTLFILAYNRDITSFDHLAEAISRTVFCNVIVCNCGYYGGSLAVSPYREPHKRMVYQHSGAKLTNAQIVEIPLSALKNHQNKTGASNTFKNLPPGFPDVHTLIIKNEDIDKEK